MITTEELRQLAALHVEHGVLTLAARTDPRDPANARHDPPGWKIEVRNGLRDETHRVEAAGDHAAKVAFRALRDRAERRISGLEPAECGRSFVWFLAEEPPLDRLVTLQLPIDHSEVRWATRPQVAPLAAATELSAPAVIVLLGRDAVRLVRWEDGGATEVEGGRLAEPPDDRDLADSDVPDRRDARVETHHRRFLREAAHDVATHLESSGAPDVVLVGDPALTRSFAEELPAARRGAILVTVDANLHEEPLAALDHRLEPEILAVRRRRVVDTVTEVAEHARAGGRGAMGAEPVLSALAEGRVAHLVLDPASAVAEQAVEAALTSGARVSVLRVSECEALAQGGGIAAALRY